MKQQNTNTHHRSSDSLRSPEDLIVSIDDYVRLRELVADHALAEELDLAIVVPSDRIPKNVVTMNSRLIYADESTGQTREVELVYPSEADPVAGRISVLAPVGCALLGLSAGQSIDWNLPSGQVLRLRVERILSQPGSSPSGSVQ
jgi:regulator of nucleoside diphosphate kinase